MKRFFRHGDIVLEKMNNVERAEQTKVNSLIVAEGEVTGHHHEIMGIDDGEIMVLETGVIEGSKANTSHLNETCFRIKGKAVITHQEHSPIVLEEGVYIARRQTVYNPFERRLEKVRD